jgi:hypothetical protein
MGFEINVPIEELQQTRKLFIATPMYGGQASGMYCRSMMELTNQLTKMQIQHQPYFLFNESLITRARNYCTDVFVRSDCTHMLFIDSDIGFSAQDVIALLAIQTDESPYDVIGGPYPKKCISWEKIKMAVDKGFADEDPNELEKYVGDYVFNPKSGSNNIPIGEPVEVLEIGTGFMMIKKKVFEVMSEKYPHMSYKPDHVRTADFDGSREIMMYFQAEIDIPSVEQYLMPVMNKVAAGEWGAAEMKKALGEYKKLYNGASKRYLSEDYWFCQKVQEAGMQTWLCPWMKTQHVGSYNFSGSLFDLAQLGATATADPSQLQKGKDKIKRDKMKK